MTEDEINKILARNRAIINQMSPEELNREIDKLIGKNDEHSDWVSNMESSLFLIENLQNDANALADFEMYRVWGNGKLKSWGAEFTVKLSSDDPRNDGYNDDFTYLGRGETIPLAVARAFILAKWNGKRIISVQDNA